MPDSNSQGIIVEGANSVERMLSIPPTLSGSAARLEWRPATRELYWQYENVGDYNRDGVVDIADITSIAQHLFASGPYDESGPAHFADGDGNGEVNGADISVIARNFQLNVESYRVYSSTSEAGLLDPSTTLLVTEIPFEASGGIRPGAVEISHVLSPDVTEAWYRVIPVSEGIEGVASNSVAIGPAPVARLVADPPSGMVPFNVRLDATLSTPGSDTIADYAWDLDDDGVYEVSTGNEKLLNRTYEEAGEYPVHLRVTNDLGFVSSATIHISVAELDFEFLPWYQSYLNNGYVDEFKTTSWQSGGKAFVEIRADNARGIEGLYGELAYDESLYRLLDYVVLPGNYPPWDWVDLVVHGSDQRLHIGTALLNPQELPGLYGDVSMIRLRFDLLVEDSTPVAVQPPMTQPFAITSLGFDPATSSLAWRYSTHGDFNQDGRVLVSDLQIYAANHDETVPLEPGSLLRLLDADGDNNVTLDDLQAVDSGYNTSTTHFRVYASNDAMDYPAAGIGANGSGAVLVDSVDLRSGLSAPGDERRRFNISIPAELTDSYFWIRPIVNDLEGIASNLVEPGGGLYISPDLNDLDWEFVTGKGTAINLPYYLGPPAPDRGFDLLATTLPDGSGGVIDPANLIWTVSPASSADIPTPGVFVPNGPIGMGYIQAEDIAGNLSNKLYFFAATTPGT